MRPAAPSFRAAMSTAEGDRRDGRQQLPEFALADDEEAHRRRGLHGRRTGCAVDETHLAEEVALPESDRAPPGGPDDGLAVHDDEELAPGIPGAGEFAAG